MASRVIVVTDLDNTLYNFVDYFAPAFRAMVHVVARCVSLSEEEVTEDFRRTYQRYGTVEYAFAVQELTCVQALSEEQRQRTVHAARVAFGGTRRKRLRLYPGVKETLLWLSANCTVLCAVTNAPAYQVYRRLHDLGIARLFTAIGAWEGNIVPPSEPAASARYAQHLTEIDKRVSLSMRLARADSKPRPRMFEEILKRFETPGAFMVAMGDSIEKDLRPASAHGMVTVWARYCTVTDKTNQKTLDSITPWDGAEMALHYKSVYEPDFVVDAFSDVRDCFPFAYQRPLLSLDQ